MPEPSTGKTRHTELSLDQIADLQPGLAALMPMVGDRYWISYYAAQGGNWGLAGHQLRQLVRLLRQGAVTRPKHATALADYERISINPLLESVKTEDLPAFEQAFQAATREANRYHQDLGHPEIVWKLPSRPPDQLDLGPQPETAPAP